MAYRRVVPRDLFNEASLLKCYGQLYIALETSQTPEAVLVGDGKPFDVQEDFGSGGTFLSNVKLLVRGTPCKLLRPLNSREKWPLYLIGDDEDETTVFNDDGSFTEEMLQFLRG